MLRDLRIRSKLIGIFALPVLGMLLLASARGWEVFRMTTLVYSRASRNSGKITFLGKRRFSPPERRLALDTCEPGNCRCAPSPEGAELRGHRGRLEWVRPTGRQRRQ